MTINDTPKPLPDPHQTSNRPLPDHHQTSPRPHSDTPRHPPDPPRCLPDTPQTQSSAIMAQLARATKPSEATNQFPGQAASLGTKSKPMDRIS